MTAQVVEVSEVVTLQNSNGYTWQIEETEDWEVGDFASCIMYTNGTQSIKDDKIIKVIYAGRF